MKCLNIVALVLIVMAALAADVAAQVPPELPPLAPVLGAARGGVMSMRLEGNMDVAPVKSAPFCATITTEHTQSFADGNRIHTTESSSVCRDSEGRTRREAGLNLLGAGPQTSAPKLITIDDPVAGVRYILDTDNKIAHKMASASTTISSSAGDLPTKGERTFFYQNSAGPGPQTFSTNVFFAKKIGNDNDGPAPATENLGDPT
jgi:hypothetical protein